MAQHNDRWLRIGLAVWGSVLFASTEPARGLTVHAPLRAAVACDFEHGRASVEYSVMLGGRLYKARLNNAADQAHSIPSGTVVSGTWEGDVLRVTTISPAAATTAAAISGRRTLLVVFVSFADMAYESGARQEFESMLPQLASFFGNSSRGAFSLAWTVFPDTVLISAGAADAQDYARIAWEAMAQVSAVDRKYVGYDHYMFAFPRVWNLSWVGLGLMCDKYTWINGNWGWGVLAHELGHNLGLNHAHGWRPTTADPLGPGMDVEYGDAYDLMGNPFGASDYNNVYKAQLGWITPEEVLQVTRPGVVRLNGQKLAAPGVADLVSVGYEPNRCLALESAPWRPGALQVRWATRSGLGQPLLGFSYLLDMTPLSQGDFSDGLLMPGAQLVSLSQQTAISLLQPAGAGAFDTLNVRVDCPILAPQLQIVWPSFGQELLLNVPVTVTSSAPFNADNIAQAELLANGRVVSVSVSPPFELGWTPTSLGVTNLSVRTRDIYGQTAVSAPIRISITWRPETNVWTLEGTSLAHLTWGVDRWLAVVNGQLCSSTDLVSWQPVEVSPSVGGTVQAMARCSAGVVAVGSDGLIASSADGYSWSGQAVGSGSWNAVVAFGPVWIVAGDGGHAAVSADAQSWRVATVLPEDDLIALAASASQCIGIGANGHVVELSGLTNLVSDTGQRGLLAKGGAAGISALGVPSVIWPSQSLGTNVTCQGISWDGVVFWVIGSDPGGRRLYSSRDGQAWSAKSAAVVTHDRSLSVLAAVPGGPLVGVGNFIDYRLSNGAWRQLIRTPTQFQEIVPFGNQLIFLASSDAGTTLATFSLPETLYEQWTASLPLGSNSDFFEYALGSSGVEGARLRISMAGPNQARITFDAVLRPDVRYIVEESTDLFRWTYALDLPEMYPSPGPLKFFRLRLEPIPLY